MGFSKDKIIIYSDVILLEDLYFKCIYFKENDIIVFIYKEVYFDICVSMFIYDVEIVKWCYENGLDFVFFGYIFFIFLYLNVLLCFKEVI